MSNKIGFSNFRRFANFPVIDLGDVTILVGGNNSGKSTLVKALLLCVDNIRLMRVNDRRKDESKSVLTASMPLFRFDANEYHDVKVKTFARAIHNKPVNVEYFDIKRGKKLIQNVLTSSIVFEFTLGQFEFKIYVSGDRDNLKNVTTGDVSCITITDLKSQVRYTNDYVQHQMSYEVLNSDFNEQITLLKKLMRDFKKANKELDKANDEGDLESITSKTAVLDKIMMQINSMTDQDEDLDSITEEEVRKLMVKLLREKKPAQALYQLPLSFALNEVAEPVVLNVISNIMNFASTKGTAPNFKSNDSLQEEDKILIMQDFNLMEKYRQAMAQDIDVIRRSYNDLKVLLDNINVEYIPAHVATQNTIYNTADRNDYIAQTVHEFYREKILPGETEYEFIKDWMQRFEIGISFDITSIDGEAYQVRIIDADNSSVPLADKGMGSIQMMVLLLRLATILRRNHRKERVMSEVIPATIIIEEPEQNLHPKMQSLLAELFHSLATYDNCRFVIETHSEYLIRKTQVIVAEQDYVDQKELNANVPFSVYYLPTDDGVPYKMNYTPSGAFKEKFGEGFFDAATASEMVIIRKEFELKKKRK